MAVFKRKQRKVINFDFGYVEDGVDKVLHFETVHSKALADKLVDMGRLAKDDMSIEEQKEYLTRAYDEILGDGAMNTIREKLYDNEELLITDLVDIGYYLVDEVERVNKLLESEYGTRA